MATEAARRVAGYGLLGIGIFAALAGWQASLVCMVPADGGCLAYRYPDAWLVGLVAAAPFVAAGALLVTRPTR